MPFDIAFEADDNFILAWIVVKGELEGWQFDWSQMKWRVRR